MSDRIIITGISAIGFHGVYPEERSQGQRFVVDVTLSLDLSVPGTNDHLINTVDYSKVAELIHEIIVGEPFQLIERLADEIAHRVLRTYSLVHSIEVTVHKPDAPVGISISDLAVQLTRHQ